MFLPVGALREEGHTWEKYFIGLLHVSEHVDHGKKQSFPQLEF